MSNTKKRLALVAVGLGVALGCLAAGHLGLTRLWAQTRTKAIEVGDIVAVARESAELRVGDAVVATLRSGQELKVSHIDGQWIGTAVESGGKLVRGWILREAVELRRKAGELPDPAEGGATSAQTMGVPGSPGATTTISGKQLPPPAPKFGGVIKEKAAQSRAWWPPRVVPPKGAPNVLLIMTDDCGFGSPSTFGGVIPTPALDRVAKNGLSYTQFHSTSLCSPTRAALITGRNHHTCGYGVVGEAATGFPGYDSVIRKECGTIGEILKGHGYATSWFGKNHNTPFYQTSVAGPFDQWPGGLGMLQ